MNLSIIVPIYNREKFLPRCLDSLLRQGMEVGEYEIICVNDGSLDNSATILAEYEARVPEIIKVITQENRGVGEARNTGMKVAIGEYIAFVDSDDYVVDNGFAYLCKHFLEGKPDVLTFGYKILDYDDINSQEDVLVGKVLFEGDGVEWYNSNKGVPEVCTKLYRRDYLIRHNLYFENVLSEDLLFNFQVFRRNPHVIKTDMFIYRYMMDNKDSIMRTTNRDRIYALMDGQVHAMSVMSTYFQEDETPMAKGVKIYMYELLKFVYKEAYHVHLPLREWKHYMGKIRKLGVNTFSSECEEGNVAKIIANLKNASSRSYLMYLIVEFLYGKVFERYILPKLS